MEQKCPSADTTYRASDVYDVECPKCGTELEFFGDDRQNKCHKCGEVVKNPRLADG